MLQRIIAGTYNDQNNINYGHVALCGHLIRALTMPREQTANNANYCVDIPCTKLVYVKGGYVPTITSCQNEALYQVCTK